MTSAQIALLVYILLGSGVSADKVAKINSVLESAHTPVQTQTVPKTIPKEVPKAVPVPTKPVTITPTTPKPAEKETPPNPRCSLYADYKEIDGEKKVEVRWYIYDAVGAEIRYYSGNWVNNGMYFSPAWNTSKLATSSLPSGSMIFPTKNRYLNDKLTYLMYTYDKNHGYNASCRIDLDKVM